MCDAWSTIRGDRLQGCALGIPPLGGARLFDATYIMATTLNNAITVVDEADAFLFAVYVGLQELDLSVGEPLFVLSMANSVAERESVVEGAIVPPFVADAVFLAEKEVRLGAYLAVVEPHDLFAV